MVLVEVFLGHGLLHPKVLGEMLVPDAVDNREIDALRRLPRNVKPLGSGGVQICILLDELFHHRVLGVCKFDKNVRPRNIKET